MPLGNAIAEVKIMNSFDSDYGIRHGYNINHIPILVSQHDYGMPLFGDDPGSLLDEIQYTDKIEKLTR